MLVKSIFMELRSRLRSCHVFITTGVDFSKNCNLKISIQTNCIVLNYYDENKENKRRDSLSSIESLSDCYSEDESEVTAVIPIKEFCKIIPNSMSCLKIDKNTVSFRILTEPKNGGNIYNELLPTNDNVATENVIELKPNVKPNCEVRITCANCSNVISNDVIKFDRILELPSANLDMSEWFCHNHSHGSCSKPEIALKPNKNDFLYRLTYFVIDNSLLTEKSNKFNVKRIVYHCNRCLAWLGLKGENNTVKLFNSEIKIHQNNEEGFAFVHQNLVHHLSTEDFIFTIEFMIREFNLGMQYAVMCKIMLECTVSVSKKQYLLVWIMDKELQVLRNVDCMDDKIELQSSLLTKILYKVELSLNDEVAAWQADPAVVTTDISKSMFYNGLEHLKSMSLKMPELCRDTNGYCVSYLKV